MIVWILMGEKEFVDFCHGIPIRPCHKWWSGCNTYNANTGMCFFMNANNCYHWDCNSSASRLIVALAIDESLLEFGYGYYAGYDYGTYQHIMEACIPEYSQENATLIGYGYSDDCIYGVPDAMGHIKMYGGIKDQPVYGIMADTDEDINRLSKYY